MLEPRISIHIQCTIIVYLRHSVLDLLPRCRPRRYFKCGQVLVEHSLVFLEQVIRGLFGLGIYLLFVLQGLRLGALSGQRLRGVGFGGCQGLMLEDLGILALHEDFRVDMLEFRVQVSFVSGRIICELLEVPRFVSTFEDSGWQFRRYRIACFSITVFGWCH